MAKLLELQKKNALKLLNSLHQQEGWEQFDMNSIIMTYGHFHVFNCISNMWPMQESVPPSCCKHHGPIRIKHNNCNSMVFKTSQAVCHFADAFI